MSTPMLAAERAALRTAAARAMRAPSEHNAQPWRWVLGPDGLDLHVDRSRRLRFTDERGHGTLLGCGCALHHLQVALAGDGWLADVRHQPDGPADRPLARIRIRPADGEPDARTSRHAAAIDERHTDRRRFSGRSVSPAVLGALDDAARPFGGVLHLTYGGHRALLAGAMRDAAARQPEQEGYLAELNQWTHRYAGAHDGIPAGARLDGPPPSYRDLVLRWFPRGTLRQPHAGADHEDASALAVLTAVDDDPVSVLRAGEALSAVLLEATAQGLGTTPVTQVLEVPETRELVRHLVVGAHRPPVCVLRLGWPDPLGAPLVPTPRRPLEQVLTEVG
ncbi:NAD(P)H nitroreductase [Actinomycetospora sp. NBRC 106375]|uniref:Acg family FMN-binding oxidoreductase n=1 Tax=Actinomycetospora sp. NBRC 106375 TaxID=3032207 RepID=UPI00249FE9B8|nr:NAD(P)H nitroreductase [Actinomycetospora sp. NBRC 106375]GLZ49661.1 NAD(P)H nitroreductase [Actinomycetospora sp. NBRC 106375]